MRRAFRLSAIIAVLVTAACTQAPGDVSKNTTAHPGRAVLGNEGCLSCHAVQGQGGNLAPELGAELAGRGEAWILDYLTSGRHLDVYPGNGHAMFAGLSEERARDLAGYLATLTVSSRYQGPAPGR